MHEGTFSPSFHFGMGEEQRPDDEKRPDDDYDAADDDDKVSNVSWKPGVDLDCPPES